MQIDTVGTPSFAGRHSPTRCPHCHTRGRGSGRPSSDPFERISRKDRACVKSRSLLPAPWQHLLHQREQSPPSGAIGQLSAVHEQVQPRRRPQPGGWEACISPDKRFDLSPANGMPGTMGQWNWASIEPTLPQQRFSSLILVMRAVFNALAGAGDRSMEEGRHG
jgi:hypothetical protein